MMSFCKLIDVNYPCTVHLQYMHVLYSSYSIYEVSNLHYLMVILCLSTLLLLPLPLSIIGSSSGAWGVPQSGLRASR